MAIASMTLATQLVLATWPISKAKCSIVNYNNKK